MRIQRITWCGIVSLATVAVAATGASSYSVLYVDDDNCPGPGDGSELDPYCSIQTAIDNAVDTDEIVVAPGTYFETINLLGLAITLHSSDGQDVTTIDAVGAGTVVTCNNAEGPDTVLEGFTVTGGNSVFGGGMRNAASQKSPASNPTVRNCTFVRNNGNIGGGMFNGASSPTVVDCVFRENVSFDGGGIYNSSNSSPTVTNCLFVGNNAGTGAGMFNGASSPTVTNCTFSRNIAQTSGGGIIGAATITNCIVWDNTPDQIQGGGIIVNYTDVQGGYPGTGNIDADPLFVDPDNGDFRLQAGSPCIDAADNTAVPMGITKDLDGNPRFANDLATTDTGNGACPIVDMGAYEFPASCPSDVDCDGNVGITDFLALLAAWGTNPGGSPDIDGDGTVGITDFLELLANWGSCL